LRSSECLLEGGIGGALPGGDNRAQAEERDEKKPEAHQSLLDWMNEDWMNEPQEDLFSRS
jgi:hypothetical protein